ncbi:DUF1800 domain-containing protein [Vibrio paucivorans]
MIRTNYLSGWLLTCCIFVSWWTVQPTNASETELSDEQTYRFLEQATFGPTASSIEQLKHIGLDEWLSDQFELLPTSHLALYSTSFPGHAQRNRQNAWYQIAISSPDQLRQKYAYALSQVLVVSRHGGKLNSRAKALTHYYDMLVNNAFGNYRDILEQATLHAAMGNYLSMLGSKVANPNTNSYPDENYAREVMQLFTIGLYELNLDGSHKLQSGQPIPTYTQTDIEEVARAFTGWKNSDWAYMKPMKSLDKYHDFGEKTVLGHTLPANQTPYRDVTAVLDILFEHPNLAPHVSRLLIQRLVTSNPSPNYIKRVSSVFNDNGEGVKGDMKAVLVAILTDQEALGEDVHKPIKLKEPLLVATHYHRAMGLMYDGARMTVANRVMNNAEQEPQASPSVFNYYSPDYQPPGILDDQDLYAPEFELLGWSTYASLVNHLGHYLKKGAVADMYLDLDELYDVVDNNPELVEVVNLRLFGGTMSQQLEMTLVDGLDEYGDNVNPYKKLYHAVIIALSSDEFFIQN